MSRNSGTMDGNSGVKVSVPIFVWAAFFLAAELLIVFVLPPYQNPDEPDHFGALYLKVLGEAKRDLVEREIVAGMDRYDWWRFIGMGRPNPVPARLSEILFITDYSRVDDFRLGVWPFPPFQVAVGTILRAAASDDVGVAYRLFRLLSILMTLGTLAVAWLTFRKSGRALREDLSGAFFFILFLPQFLILASSTTPDPFCWLMAAIFFWAAFSLILEKPKPLTIAVLFLTAATGILADRSTLAIPAIAVVLVFFIANRKNWQGIVLILLGAIVLSLAVVSLLAVVSPSTLETSFFYIRLAFSRTNFRIDKLFSWSAYNKGFVRYFVDGFLLKFGWMAYWTEKAFYIVWRGVAAAAAIGIAAIGARAVFRHPNPPRRNGDPVFSLKFKLVAFSASAVVIQVLAVWVYYSRTGDMPQGRYLYPVLVPAAFLLTEGVRSLFGLLGRKAGRAALAVFILAEFLFLGWVIWNNLIPVFHLTMKAPHPGI